jgi:FTR1 family protein
MTGLREGLESILFLAAVVVDAKDLTSLPLPIITAVILARICGWCFFKSTNKVRVEYFMKGSSIVLMFIAAGFFSVGTHNFQELAVFGTWSPKADRPWQNTAVWNLSDCCNDKTNRFWVLMRAMLGWQDQPTPIEFFAWGFYWVVIFTVGSVMLRRVKKQLAEMQERWRQADAEKQGQADAEVEGGNGEKIAPLTDNQPACEERQMQM